MTTNKNNRVSVLYEQLQKMLATPNVTLSTTTTISLADLKFILAENKEMHSLCLKLIKKHNIKLETLNLEILTEYFKQHPKARELLNKAVNAPPQDK